MEQCERKRAISCLKLAIELAGDGGPQPFTDVEYKLMYQLLDELSTNDEFVDDVENYGFERTGKVETHNNFIYLKFTKI
jgi:hypothetical protein